MSGLVVTNAQLLDTAAGEIRTGASVRVEGDRIVEVAEDAATLSRPDDIHVIDVAGGP